MKLRTTLAALTAASALSVAAQAQTSPPTPRPAAGALSQPNPNAVQKSFRTQSSQEQQSSNAAPPIEVGQSGRARVAATGGPPTPRPAAGALSQPNPNAVQKSFRTQTSQEQQSSSAASPMDIGPSGRARSPN